MENGPFIDVLPVKMVIFNSYVSLPEGTHPAHHFRPRASAQLAFGASEGCRAHLDHRGFAAPRPGQPRGRVGRGIQMDRSNDNHQLL